MRVLGVALLASALAWAQSALPLSMKRAVEIALAPDGSTRTALARESIQQAEQRVAQAKSAFLPNLDAAVQDLVEQFFHFQLTHFAFKLERVSFVPVVDFVIELMLVSQKFKFVVVNFLSIAKIAKQ